MAVPQQPSGIKNGWRFYVPVIVGIASGVLLIAAADVLGRTHFISSDVRDAGLVVGGALLGLVALALDELYRTGPALRRMRRERETEFARHQEERRLDFEQYRALQTELREARAHSNSLEKKLELTGALDRDRIGDALLLGFYFDRRRDGLPSSPKQSIFKTAAVRLKVLSSSAADVRLEKPALHSVLEIVYGPVVAESFDLGYVLSHLGADGLPRESSIEILGEIEKQLGALKLDTKPWRANGTAGISSNIRNLASRVVSIIRHF